MWFRVDEKAQFFIQALSEVEKLLLANAVAGHESIQNDRDNHLIKDERVV